MHPRRVVHVVDDEAPIRLSINFMLTNSGYEVTDWPSGEAFLAAIETLEPGCILLDIGMPDMDGLQVQQVLHDRGITMPVILFSGLGSLSLGGLAMRGGAAAYIEKPFERTALLAAVDAAYLPKRNGWKDGSSTSVAARKVAAVTRREQRLLDGIADGLPNHELARDLRISLRVLELHRARLLSKLGSRGFSIATGVGVGMRDPRRPFGAMTVADRRPRPPIA